MQEANEAYKAQRTQETDRLNPEVLEAVSNCRGGWQVPNGALGMPPLGVNTGAG